MKAFRLGHDNMSHSVLGIEKFPDGRFSLLFVFRLEAIEKLPFLSGSLVSPEMKENILSLHLFINSRHSLRIKHYEITKQKTCIGTSI